jgi:formylmethanofuran dehydrogenase subunit E
MDDIKSAVSFHGHLCPMYYLGLRMGGNALKRLNRGRERGIKLQVVVEFANCFGDGIQFVVGATYGKNNLHLDDKGKFAASFYDVSSKKSLRLIMREDVLKKVLVYGRAGKDVKSLPHSDREEEAARLMEAGKEMVEWLKTLSDEELFSVSAPPGFKPVEGASLEYVKCKLCRELTLKEYSRMKAGAVHCLSCLNIR